VKFDDALEALLASIPGTTRVRTMNVVENLGIETLSQLKATHPIVLLAAKHSGRKTVQHLIDAGVWPTFASVDAVYRLSANVKRAARAAGVPLRADVEHERERAELRDLERIIVDGVSGMDPDDTIGSVKVHYADGSTAYLFTVIERANMLRADIQRGAL
jgi:hypothetical protein